jgi:hypothetical protein
LRIDELPPKLQANFLPAAAPTCPIDKPEPIRANCLRERELPKLQNERIDNAEPNLAALLKLIVEPMLVASIMDIF